MVRTLEFANVTLTFGPKHIMADFLNEIVLPAFTDPSLERTYGDTAYFLEEVQVINLGTAKKSEPAIVGRFIKDTVLKREQVYDRSTASLKKSPKSLKSSPSAAFVLLLTNHKLLYLHETSQAPGLEAFRNTIYRFLVWKYMDYVEREHERLNNAKADEDPKITKKSLREKYPPPELAVIPLANESTIAEAAGRYGVLSSLQIEMQSVNAEFIGDPFFAAMRREKEAAGAEAALFIEKKDSGLNKVAAAKQLVAAAAAGTNKFALDGRTPNGDKLRLTNEDAKLKIAVANLPDGIPAKAKRMSDLFSNAIITGEIVIGETDEAQVSNIRGKFDFQ